MVPEPKSASASPRGRNLPVFIVGGVAALALVVVGVVLFTRPTSAVAPEKQRPPDEPLPYVNYVPVRSDQRGKVGTTTFLKEQASPGYNLYVQKPDSAALLIDMQGEIVHRWASTEGQAEHPLDRWRGFRTVRMTPKGDLYAAIDHKALIKLDWSSHLLWKADVAAHHEIVIADDGDVYAMGAELRLVQIDGHDRAIEDDVVVVVSPEGTIKRKISLFDVFAADATLMKQLADLTNRRFAKLDKKGLAALVKKRPGSLEQLEAFSRTAHVDGLDAYENFKLSRDVPGGAGDVFHANAIVLLKDHPKGIWKDGDIMVSFRYLNLLVAFDPADDHVKWTWGPGEVSGQHQPSILPNGDVLVYDNGSWRKGDGEGRRRRRRRAQGDAGAPGNGKYSRIIEVDPVSKSIVWSYEGTPPSSFYSPAEGGAQLLPNGDILAAEEGGRAFEITRSKQIVWEYFNPKFDETGKARSGMYRMERLPVDVVAPLLAGKPAAP
jgi:hypothetical protein